MAAHRLKKLLVVDDESEIVDFLKDYFRDKGYQVFKATTSDQALESVEKDRPDVVLLDIRLTSSPTNYNGIQVLGEIRKKHPQIKVIMVTAVEDADIINQTMALGASDYITKPLSLEYLEKTVTSKIQELLSPQLPK